MAVQPAAGGREPDGRLQVADLQDVGGPMLKIRLALSIPVLLALLATPAPLRAQKTSHDYDPGVDFSRFRTYAWTEGKPAPEQFLHQRIVAAIESQLAAKGLTRSDTDPDLYVTYHAVMDVQRSITGFRTGTGIGPFGWGWGGGLDSINLNLNEVPIGTLVIDVGDAAKHQLVWRGLAVKEIDFHAKPEKRDAGVVKAVAKILKNYPPKSPVP
jgi:hypothetical protein